MTTLVTFVGIPQCINTLFKSLKMECGNIYLVAKEDWVGGPGSTPLMAAFTHRGNSRFSDAARMVFIMPQTLYKLP